MSAESTPWRALVRVVGNAAIIAGMGLGLACVIAPLIDPRGGMTDSPLPYAVGAFAMAIVGFVMVRWSRTP